MRDLAPGIMRQRLLVEGFYTADLGRTQIQDYMLGVAEHLGLGTYASPTIFSPEGSGRQENQGFDAFLPLVDSGISVYVWTGSRFVAVVLFTCKAFDEAGAVEYTWTVPATA